MAGHRQPDNRHCDEKLSIWTICPTSNRLRDYVVVALALVALRVMVLYEPAPLAQAMANMNLSPLLGDDS